MKLSPTAHKWVRGLVDYGGLVVWLAAFLAYLIAGTAAKDALLQATWFLVGGSIVALLVGLIFERRIAPLPLISALLGIVAGGLTLVFHDVRFLKMKPTVVNFIFAAALLGGLAVRKNPLRSLMGEAIKMSEEGWRKLALNYGLFFLAMAALNEVVWRTQSDTFWVFFKFPGLLILSVLFSFAQAPLMMKYAKTDEPPPPHVE